MVFNSGRIPRQLQVKGVAFVSGAISNANTWLISTMCEMKGTMSNTPGATLLLAQISTPASIPRFMNDAWVSSAAMFGSYCPQSTKDARENSQKIRVQASQHNRDNDNFVRFSLSEHDSLLMLGYITVQTVGTPWSVLAARAETLRLITTNARVSISQERTLSEKEDVSISRL